MERYGRSFRDESFAPGRSAFVGGGFSWSPRSYTCSFCKREFKSAQALGGHMNVHRRDRARLRQSPPPREHPPLSSANPNPNPLPNLNFSPPPCSSEAKPSLVTYTFPSLLSPRTRSTATAATAMASSPAIFPGPFHPKCDELKGARAVKALFGVRMLGSFMEEDGMVLTRSERDVVGIDLETKATEDLDLELRLGYA